MALTYDGTNGITFNDGSQMGTGHQLGMRNRIINGNMVINQRAFSGTPNNEYTLDRWNISNAQTGKLTVSQSSDAPAGFVNSLLVTSSSAYTTTATDFFGIQQRIEGYNIADLNFGSANAKTITISFWVKSSLTGTFSGAINNGAWDTSYAFTYVINSASTWEYKTVTIVGTSSGTWLTTNGNGMRVWFNLGLGTTYATTANTWVTGSGSYGVSGTINVVGTNAATFQITGVQLEKGSVATPFEYRQYGTELALCQRYFQTYVGSQYLHECGGGATTSTAVIYFKPLIVSMRTSPTFAASGTFNADGTSYTTVSLGLDYASTTNVRLQGTASGFTAGQYYGLTHQTTNSSLQFSAEL